MIYRIHAVGLLPPTSNTRLKARTDGRLRRDDRVGRFQRDFGFSALSDLRRQGLRAPLEGPVLCQVVWGVPNGRRDVDAGLKDTLDALNGVAWRDDRQLVCCPPAMVDRHAEEPCTVVWLARAGDLEAWWQLVGVQLGVAVGTAYGGVSE